MRRKDKEIKLQPDDFPANRWKQFLWVMRRHFFEVAMCSLLMGLFALPAAGWVFFVSATAFFDLSYLWNVFLVYLVLALLLGITGLGSAGATFFFHRLTWNEGAYLYDDFFEGIRKNGKHFAAIGFMMGVLYFFIRLLAFFADVDASVDPGLKAVFLGLAYAFFILVFSVFSVMGPLDTTYEGGFLKNLGISGKIALVNLYKGLWFDLLTLLPFFLFEFIPNIYIQMIVFLVAASFYLGFGNLVSTLYANSLFDRAFNRRLYPKVYRKGLTGQGDVNYQDVKK